MFPDDPATVRRPRTICLVAENVDRLIGGEVTSLRELDVVVHVLGCGRTPRCIAEIRSAGIHFHQLKDFSASDVWPNVHGPCPADGGDRVRAALEQLHRQHSFAGIVFSALGGLGFRSLQAREARRSFQDVRLGVYLDSCTAWLRSREERWSDGLEDLELDFLERRAFERADVQAAREVALLEYVRAGGWMVRQDGAPVTLRETLLRLIGDDVRRGDHPPSQKIPILARR